MRNPIFWLTNESHREKPMRADNFATARQRLKHNEQPTHKTAHLALPDTRANASQNQKSHFFATVPTRIVTLKRIK